LISVLLLAWTAIGHNYRPSIEVQTATWHDGLQEYYFERSTQDSFDPKLYEKTRSVNEAVRYILEHYQPKSEEERLRAAYNFTRKRFMHFMYPHHTWRTNPYLALAEFLFPTKPFNGMYLADDNLRHSAVTWCGGAATIFIEIYRAMGGEAQTVSFLGHDIAEARIGNQYYFVDADLERFAQGRVKQVAESESRLRSLYAGYSEERINHYVGVFATNAIYGGYYGPSTNSPRIQKIQAAIAYGKWIAPAGLMLLGVGLLLVSRSNS